MYQRFVELRIREALADTPVALVVGPRRAGKTTLVQAIGSGGRNYMTLDNLTTLSAARDDPIGFVRGLGPATIDEVQRVPELLLAIKQAVDDDYRPGSFLLTGSANVMTLPRVADSLAGRMEIVRLLPLAQAEIIGHMPTFLDRLFEGELAPPKRSIVGQDLVELVFAGGFPEALARRSERRRQDWAMSYLDSILVRDLRDIAVVDKLAELPKFARLLAQHAGQLVNSSALGAAIGVTHKTAQRYVSLLEQLFVVMTLPPWYSNAVKRLVKTPKLHFLDSGLLAACRGLTSRRAMTNRAELGPILECFAFAEILKLMSWSGRRLTPYHFRDQQQNEVDIVLERDDGIIVGIEIKAGATVRPADLTGLRKLAEACGSRFRFGVVLHDSDTVVPFGTNLAAAPISCLWQ